MTQKKKLRIGSWLLGLAGIALAALCIQYCFSNLNAPARILRAPDSAAACTDALMENICQGNYDSIGQYLQGSPDLELSSRPKDVVGQLLWDAWQSSMTYEFTGECYTTEAGMARDLRFSCLDISSVTDALPPIAQEIFHDRVESAEDQYTIYDEHNNYREDFIQDVMVAAVQQSLADNAVTREVTVTVELSYHQGQWLVVPSQEFMDAVFGEITG